MLYFIAIFCSPLALLLAGKPISAVFNLILYVLSIVCWLTIIFFHAGFVLWALALLHAVMAISDARADRRARRMVQAGRWR
jgi:protein-S-isoprenylcysteine O-methyltransferase Ste14